jgi:hypothetical protein
MKNRTHVKMSLLATAMMFVAMSSAKADGIDLAQLLHGGPSCDHVINLMLRHGVNNSHSVAVDNVAHHSPFGPMLIPATELGDLELIQVAQLQHVDAACGPKFAVTVRNNSTRDVCGFRISLVALLGRIHPMAPTAVVKVDKVCAGAEAEFHLQMPIECLAMGNRNGQVIGFQRLVVAIDSFDQFVECNEANNIKVWARTAIPMATVIEKTEETVETAAPAAAATAVAGAVATAPAVQPSAPAQPAGVAPAAPQAGGAGNDLQNAINQLSEQQQTPAAAKPADLTL